MVGRTGEFSFIQGIHVRIDMKIDISISVRPLTTKFGSEVHREELILMRLIRQVLVTSSR